VEIWWVPMTALIMRSLCILSRQTAKELKIDDKVAVYLEDAINLDKWKKKYDLIIITLVYGHNLLFLIII
jgi:protein-L-isoaspartate O-methyltransferase